MRKRLIGRIALLVMVAALTAFMVHAGEVCVPADGLYTVGVTSSSDMFRVVKCVLHVEDGAITAVLTLSGKGYGYLYVGTGAQADAAPKSDWVPYVPDADGAYTYAIAIPELDANVAVAAYSIKYSKWYDRTLNFQSGSLREYDLVPEDGSYSAQASSDTLEVGDCVLVVQGGAMTARFSLEGYDALRAGEQEYKADGGAFSLPIASLDKDITVQALGADGTWSDHSVRFRSDSLASLTVVPDDGAYTVGAYSDSNLFPIIGCKLTVEGGQMTTRLTVGTTKYGFIRLGTAEDAMKAAESDRIMAVPDGDSACTYTFPLETLDQQISIATWSAKKFMWYDRTLTFDSSTLAPDAGAEATPPSFAFTGGTGRVTITCSGIIQDGDRTMATIVFSSSKYTYAEVGGVKYDNTNVGGDSTFVIPVTLNGSTAIRAETIAMSTPHLVEYVLYLYTDGTDASLMG